MLTKLQRRYIAAVIRGLMQSLMAVIAFWAFTVAIALWLNVRPELGAAYTVVSAIVLLLFGWPALASDFIAQLGPFPQARRHTLRRRWRLHRLQRALRRLRIDRLYHRRLSRLQRLKDTKTMQMIMTIPAGRLNSLSDLELIAVEHMSDDARTAFDRSYRDALLALSPATKSPIALDGSALTPASRILFLPVLISAGNRRHFDRFDVERSSPTNRRYVYTATGTVINATTWESALPTISAVLGGRWRLTPIDGISISLEALPDIPARYSLDASALDPTQAFLGLDLDTAKPVHQPLSQFSHTLVVGATGVGKSTLLRAIVAQVKAGLQVEHLYIVDLKGGLEFVAYQDIDDRIEVFNHFEQLPVLLEQLNALFAARLAIMKAARRFQWDGPPVLVVIDEFAEIVLHPADKDDRKAIIDGLSRLGNQARAAGIFIWIQVQHAVAETVPTTLRRNLTTTIAFRQQTYQAAAQIFGDTTDLPADITRLKTGQFIIRDGMTSQTRAIQAPLVPPGTAVVLPQPATDIEGVRS